MIDLHTLVPLVLVLFFSTLVRATFGFGDALIAMPLLALFVEMKTATPLVALVASSIALVILLKDWKQVRIRSAWLLIVATAAGIPAGLLFLKATAEPFIKGILAAVIIVFALFQLMNKRKTPAMREWLAVPFGFLAGILGAAYNTNGPPVVIFGVFRQWDSRAFRATLQGYFLPTGLLIIAGHGLSGLWTKKVFSYYGITLPVVLLAIWIGNNLHERLDTDRFHKGIYGLLTGFGLLLIIRILI
jgi:uncharacterized membrane protein YfcA